MEKKKDDRRVLYTKMFLRESLLDLLETKPIEKITPTELCRHAGINRNTFYAHYRSPEELLHSIESELLSTVKCSIAEARNFVSVLYELRENSDFCKLLQSPNCSHQLWQRVLQDSVEQYLESWKNAGTDVPEDIRRRVVKYVVNGAIAVVQDWMQAGMQTPPEEVARLLELLVSDGVNAVKVLVEES